MAGRHFSYPLAGAAITLLFAMAASAAHATNGSTIARSNACMSCHAMDRKMIGPSFQQIAARYRGDSRALARLEQRVKNGSSGVWGMIPMPSHPGMSDADIHTVVAWILTDTPLK